MVTVLLHFLIRITLPLCVDTKGISSVRDSESKQYTSYLFIPLYVEEDSLARTGPIRDNKGVRKVYISESLMKQIRK